MMKELAMATLVAGVVCTASAGDAVLPLTREWDKIFPTSGKVEHCKATFRNRFGITLVADVIVLASPPNAVLQGGAL